MQKTHVSNNMKIIEEQSTSEDTKTTSLKYIKVDLLPNGSHEILNSQWNSFKADCFHLLHTLMWQQLCFLTAHPTPPLFSSTRRTLFDGH